MGKIKINMSCTSCNQELSYTSNEARCPDCNEPFELPIFSEGKINSRAFSSNFMERYLDFYPYLKGDNIFSLGEGMTGLVECCQLEKDLGFEPGTLFIKNETQNLTWSFKDRGTAIAMNFAKQMAYDKIGVCSSGNMAASVAAYSAAFGMDSYIFVPSYILDEKILPIAVYGSKLIKVEGDFGSLAPRCAAMAKELNMYFPNSDVPMRVEGSKSIAFEICEQTSFNPPDWVLVPNSAGGNIRGIEKGFQEFKAAGYIDRVPKIVPVQAEECCPVVKAYEKGEKKITHFGEPKTIAHAVANPYPPSGNRVLELVKMNRLYRPIAIPETDILTYQRKLALNGIFAQPASALGVAAAKKLLDNGTIRKGESVVAIVTGSGLKATSVLTESKGYDVRETKLEEIENFMRNLID